MRRRSQSHTNERVIESVAGSITTPDPTRIEGIDKNDNNEESKELDRAVSQFLGLPEGEGCQADD